MKGVKVYKSMEFKSVLDKLNVDEKFTKSEKQIKYTKFIDGIVPIANCNYMCDLIEMPRTSEGMKWLLVVLDLATSIFDAEPMKNKSSETTLDAFKAIIKRGILKLPEISLKSDGGTEFKGAFDKYLENNKILHLTSMPYRKTQMSPIEALNNTITRILMTYLENETRNEGNEDWTDILRDVVTEVNEFRERDLEKLKEYQDKRVAAFPDIKEVPKFAIGDYVHYKLDKPVDQYGNLLHGSFRNGDRKFSVDVREIVGINFYPKQRN